MTELPTVFFITHPDVAIDPNVPVPDWPLSERGRARMHATSVQPWLQGVRRIFASSERKARDAAQILAEGLGLDGYSIVDDLGENDRSATGYLSKPSPVPSGRPPQAEPFHGSTGLRRSPRLTAP